MKNYFHLFLVLALLVPQMVFANVDMANDTIHRYDADGLAHNEVLTVAIGRKGHKFFGTPEGISELDGNDWYLYKKGDRIPNAAVTALALDRDNNLWVGSDAGLNRIDQVSKVVSTFGANIGATFERVFSLEISGNDSVWVGSDNGVVLYDENQRWKFFGNTDSDFSTGYVYAIDPNHVLVGAGTEVAVYSGERWTMITSPIRIPYVITDLHAISSSEFMLGTSIGLIHVQGESWEIIDSSRGLVNDYVTCLKYDGAGGYWIGTKNGLSKYKQGSFTNFTTADGLASNKVNDIAVASSGAAWIATSNGVSTVSGKTVRTYRAKQVFHDVMDVPWAKPYITDLKAKGIISGYSDGSFRPKKPVTRAEALKIAYNAAEVDVDFIDPTFLKFRDVQHGHWSSKYVAKAIQDESMFSRNRYVFAPDDHTTRAEAIMAVLGAFGVELQDSGSRRFSDTQDWQVLPVETAVGLGIVKGFSDGTFKPNLPVTRAEFSKMIYQAMQLSQ